MNHAAVRRGVGTGRAVYAAPSVVFGAVAVAAGLALWELTARWLSQPVQLPPISSISRQGVLFLFGPTELLGSTLFEHSAASVSRIAVGFLVGSVLGMTVAWVMGAVAVVRRLLDPLVNFIRFIPPIAWISPFLIWFGIGELSKIALVTYTVMFMVLLNTLAGMGAVHRSKVQAAQAMGADRWQVVRWVVIPSAVRFTLDGMRIALGNAFTTIVAAEMIAAQVGLGYVILVSRNTGGTDVIFLAMIVLGVLGLAVDRLFVYATSQYARRFYLG